MPDIWMDVDVALSEVPVNRHPLTDDTDGKTRETSVAYNAAGMDLVWNFMTSAGAFTQTAVTPTTGGDYDWTNQGKGDYTIEIPASGGASINNDTEGFGWFHGYATGILPWTGPVIGFRAAEKNDFFVEGTAQAFLNKFGILHEGTAAAIAAGTITLASGHGITATTIMIWLKAGTTAYGKAHLATYSGSGDVFNVDPDWDSTIMGLAETTPSGTIQYVAMPIPAPTETNLPAVNVTQFAGSSTDLSDMLARLNSLVLVQTTIATLASQTSFTLTAGSADNNAYKDCAIVVTDQTTATQKAIGRISAYTGATKTVTLAVDPAIFTMATGDLVSILPRAAVNTVQINNANVVGDGNATPWDGA